MTCFIVIALPYMLNCNNYATLPLNLQLTVIESNERIFVATNQKLNISKRPFLNDFGRRLLSTHVTELIA